MSSNNESWKQKRRKTGTDSIIEIVKISSKTVIGAVKTFKRYAAMLI